MRDRLLVPYRTEVRLFGSRAKGDHRPNSDIDLALWGGVDIALLAHIAQELDDLPLPYTFDVTAYQTVRHPDLKEHINRVGRVLCRRDTSRAANGRVPSR